MTINIYRHRTLLVVLISVVLAIGLLALASAKPAWAEQRSFPTPQNFGVGNLPTTVANADFNGDGKMDLAAQNSGSNSVSVLLGNGDGTLQTKQDYTVGSTPSSVISQDFNDDGVADLAVSNQNSHSVSILLGNKDNGTGKGDGTFQAKQDFDTGSGPTSVASEDFDNDGKIDLAVSNYSSDSISILRGNGDGTFQTKQDFSSGGSSPNQVISEDFNKDDKMDLATTDVGTEIVGHLGGVVVLLGKGDGTFQAPSKVLTSAFCFSVNSGDFNGDGTKDLAAVGPTSPQGAVTVALGSGDGTFQTAKGFTVGDTPSAVTSADLDGDTKVDLAVSNFASGDVSVLWGNDDGSFQAKQDFKAHSGPIFVIGADLNADDFTDLAVANQNSNDISVLLNTPPSSPPELPSVASYTPTETTGVPRNTQPTAIFSTDMDRSTIEADNNIKLEVYNKKKKKWASVAHTVKYDTGTKTATITPVKSGTTNTISLAASKKYRVTVTTNVTSSSGVALDQDANTSGNQPKTWTFTTGST